MKRNEFAKYQYSLSDYNQVVDIEEDLTQEPTSVRLNNVDTIDTIASVKLTPEASADDDTSSSSWSIFVKMTKKTLGMTHGLIMALFWTFVITFVVFPAVV